MLKKFDKLYNSIITEQTEQKQAWIRQVTKDTEFLKKYVLPLAEKCVVYPEKARMNTFRITGEFKAVHDFLDSLKVDKEFLEQPKEFFICSPMYTFCDDMYTHILNRDEGFPVGTVDPYSTLAAQNKFRFAIFGRWYELMDDGIRVKRCKPTEFAKLLAKQEINDKTIICVEFQVNCEGYTNQCFDMWSTFVPTEKIGEEPKMEKPDIDLTMQQIKEKNNIPKSEETDFDKKNVVKTKFIKIKD